MPENIFAMISAPFTNYFYQITIGALLLTGFISCCSAQSFRPAVSLFASRYAGKSYTGSRMHHPGAEFALYAGKKNLEPMIRFSIGRVSGEDAFSPYKFGGVLSFTTEYRTLAAGINYNFKEEKKFNPQIRISGQFINFTPKDFNQRSIPIKSNNSLGLQYGFGLRYRVSPQLSLQLNYEYCRVFNSEFTGEIINGKNGYNLIGLSLILGNKSD